MLSFLHEIAMFLGVRKKYWLLPIFTVLMIFGAHVVLTAGSATAPYIYTLYKGAFAPD